MLKLNLHYHALLSTMYHLLVRVYVVKNHPLNKYQSFLQHKDVLMNTVAYELQNGGVLCNESLFVKFCSWLPCQMVVCGALLGYRSLPNSV